MKASPIKSFDVGEIDGRLDQRHRDVMLELILVWGTLDGAIGMMLSRVLGLTYDQGADAFWKMSSSDRLNCVRQALRDNPSGTEAARFIGRVKKKYEKISKKIRSKIAHSHCAGVWRRNRDFIVFAPFENVGGGQLAVDLIPVQEMERAIRWGRAVTTMALKIADLPYGNQQATST